MISQKQKVIQDIDKILSQGIFPFYFKKVMFFTIQNKKPTLKWLKTVRNRLEKKIKIAEK